MTPFALFWAWLIIWCVVHAALTLAAVVFGHLERRLSRHIWRDRAREADPRPAISNKPL